MAFGNQEFLLIGLVVLLLFGAAAIPKLANSLGRAKGEFQKARKEFDNEMKQGEAASTDEELESRIRRTARDLGIDEEGRPLDDVKKDINAKLG